MRSLLRKRLGAGFTLIELVLVITILGVLAALPIPRFANLQDSARQAALSGMMGSIRSSAALANAVSRSQQLPPNAPIQMEGAAIPMLNRYPDAPGMFLAANLGLGSQYQTAMFGDVAFIVWATGTPGWTSCGFAYVRAIPPAFPLPRYFGPLTPNCQ